MESNIVLLLRQIDVFLEQYGRGQMKSLDLSPSQGLALAYLLSRKGQTVFATELHEKFGLSKPAISATLKGLKQKGYLDMRATPADDRKKQILLTAKAYAMEKQINECLREQQNLLCENIPREQLEILKKGLHTMLENMKRETIRRNKA